MNNLAKRLAGAALCDSLTDGDAAPRLAASGCAGAYPCDLFSLFSPSGSSKEEAGAELVIDDGSFRVFHRPLREAVEVKRAVERAGLSLSSAHFMETLPPPGEPPEWIFPVHERFLETAKAAGLSFATTHVGAMFSMPGDLSMDFKARCDAARSLLGERRMFEDSVAVYKKLCFEAAKRGIAISVETGCLELPSVSCDIARLLEFIALVGAPNLGVCVDAGHCHLRGMNLPHVVERCGSALFELHVHDNNGDADTHSPVGAGSVDWPSFIEALDACGYSGEVIMEQRDCETSAGAWRKLVAEFETRKPRGSV